MGTPGIYGVIIPDAGDESSTEYMPDQTGNWTQFDTHNHNGSNSALVSISSVAKSSSDLVAGDWVASGNLYRQEVTMPSGFTYDNAYIEAQITNGTYSGDKFPARTEKTGASSYYVYVSDNTLTLTMRYI